MASTTPSVSFPVRWSSFITIETREPRLILARSVPAILGNLPFLLLRSGPEGRIMETGLDLSPMILTEFNLGLSPLFWSPRQTWDRSVRPRAPHITYFLR